MIDLVDARRRMKNLSFALRKFPEALDEIEALRRQLATQSRDAREVYDRLQGAVVVEGKDGVTLTKLRTSLFQRALGILDVLSTPIPGR
jgi:hypothetical protein